MKTNIPDSVIPTELAENNRITSTYTTNTLIPRLGPLTTTRYVGLITRILRDYRVAAAGIKRAKEYQLKYDNWIKIVKPLPEYGDENLRFKAPFGSDNSTSYGFANQLSQYNSPKIDKELEGAIFSTSLPSATTGTTGGFTPVFDRTGNNASNNAGVISRSSVMDRRRIADLINTNLASNTNVPANKLSEKKWDMSNVLHLFAGDNRVVADLARNGMLQSEGDLLNDELKKIASKPESQLIEVMGKRIKLPANAKLDHIDKLIGMAVDRIPEDDGGAFVNLYKKTAVLRTGLSRYVWDYFKRIDILGGRVVSVPTPDDTDIVNSREWAFQRTERLDINLSKPEFRGAVSCESVAPNSSLTTSEVLTVARFSGETQQSGQSQQRTESHAQSYSQQFQMKLSNMTEEGVQKESEFTKNSTLFSTLRDQRRASIDQVISQISTANESVSYSEQRSTSQVSREYTTHGVDSNQAVTELAFQVVSPVKVNVSLEDVSLAWCPRIISPFMNLHRLINDHMEQARREYLAQNYVLDPVRPVEVYEKKSFKKEKHCRGRHATQAYDFGYDIPAEFSGWELDRPNCVVGFRNGTGDDYNWDEAWNWDDLENHDTYFQSLEYDGTKVSGRAVLTTTDPEYFNRGFLTFNFALQQLSEESRVALENYARERQEAEAQRLAVIARANQYARLRRDELIDSYSNNIDLIEEAYRGLIKQIFDSSNPQHHSYYAEVLRSCIDWSKTGVHFESGDSNSLPYPHLTASHFLNTPAIRLVLPIYKSSETAFFDAIEQGAGDYHNSSAAAVEGYIKSYRDHIDTLRTQDPSKLLLDNYDSEMVLGRHLEAVLSRTLFEE